MKEHSNISVLYYIAIIPELPVKQKLQELKEEISSKYGCKKTLNSPAHITMIPPFRYLEEKESEVLSHFSDFATQIQPFGVKVTGFSTFRNRTFYAVPESHPSLFDLQRELDLYFVKILNVGESRRKPERVFTPHITLANRDISAQDMKALKKEFSQKQFTETAVFKSVSLLKHNGKKWDVIKEVALNE